LLPGFLEAAATSTFSAAPPLFTNHHQHQNITIMATNGTAMIQDDIFRDLQAKIDEDSAVKDVSQWHAATNEDFVGSPNAGLARHRSKTREARQGLDGPYFYAVAI
jgi:hypothetical protein